MGGNPGDIDFYRQDKIGVGYERGWIVTEIHVMRRWQRQVARVELPDGDGKSVSEPRQSSERGRIAARAGR
jgi:hypothetical protein